MRTIQRLAVLSTLVLGAVSLTACSSMSTRDRYTAGGAVVGGVAGNVISGGSTTATMGGAAVGGVVGNQIGKREERDRRCSEMSC